VEKWFKDIYGSWPPMVQFPGGLPSKNTDGWKLGLLQMEKELRQLRRSGEISNQLHWEMMLDMSQLWMLRNHTAKGWGTSVMPADVHRDTQAEFQEGLKLARPEGETIHIEGERFTVSLSQPLKNRIREAIQPILEDWISAPRGSLKFNMMYGVRAYMNGSLLAQHADRVETHVISAVYNVAMEDLEEPWQMEALDLNGEHIGYPQKPGELFLYESAKVPHGRRGPLKGKYYASVFIHFSPQGWDMTNFDRVYATDPERMNVANEDEDPKVDVKKGWWFPQLHNREKPVKVPKYGNEKSHEL
jgi:hypothetical protein